MLRKDLFCVTVTRAFCQVMQGFLEIRIPAVPYTLLMLYLQSSDNRGVSMKMHYKREYSHITGASLGRLQGSVK